MHPQTLTADQINSVLDHVTAMLGAVGVIVGYFVTMWKLMHNNRDISINANNNAATSIPNDVAHRMIDGLQGVDSPNPNSVTDSTTHTIKMSGNQS